MIGKIKEKKCGLESCKKPFMPRRSTLEKFCSPLCEITFKKAKNGNSFAKRTPINKQSAKNKIETQKYNKSRNNLNESLKDINGDICCENCGASDVALETHHIIFRSEKPNHIHLHDEINLIKVCIPCHNEFHKNKGGRNELVEQRKLNELFGNDVLNK
jgi:5-methylcytosine-specific restriction endonuclease McrA